MDDFRIWWAGVIKTFLAWLAGAWQWLSYGLMYEWQVAWLIGGLGIVLIFGMLVIWRRKA